MITEQQIVQRIRKRDQSGLQYFHDNYSESIMGIIMRVIKERQPAEEILQITLLKIWNKIDRYDERKSGLFTWASVIARNSAIDKLRYANRISTNTIGEDISNFQLPNTAAKSNVSNEIDTEIILKSLDDKHRVLIKKMYLEGKTQKDISEEMDIPLGTVKTRLRSAIKELRAKFKDDSIISAMVLILLLSLILFLI